MPRKTSLLSSAVIAFLLAVGAAQAAPLAIHGGLYGAKETLVEAHKSAAVNVIVIDHGKKMKDVGLACSSGPTPSQGIMGETTLTMHVPGTVAITHAGTFSYSGTLTLTPEDTQSGASATTSFSIKGKFARGKIKLDKTTALTGTVTASVCGTATAQPFSLIWSTASTAI
jgi:hypothetical protein